MFTAPSASPSPWTRKPVRSVICAAGACVPKFQTSAVSRLSPGLRKGARSKVSKRQNEDVAARGADPDAAPVHMQHEALVAAHVDHEARRHGRQVDHLSEAVDAGIALRRPGARDPRSRPAPLEERAGDRKAAAGLAGRSGTGTQQGKDGADCGRHEAGSTSGSGAMSHGTSDGQSRNTWIDSLAVGFLERVDRGDVGVVERGEQVGLALEASEPLGISRHLGRQHLDRHVAIQVGVGGAIHLAHAPRAERGSDAVIGESLADHACQSRKGFTARTVP